MFSIGFTHRKAICPHYLNKILHNSGIEMTHFQTQATTLVHLKNTWQSKCYKLRENLFLSD